MFENVGIAKSAGIAAALIMGISFLPTIALQWRGHSARGDMKARI
jgi:hypothetical protein